MSSSSPSNQRRARKNPRRVANIEKINKYYESSEEEDGASESCFLLAGVRSLINNVSQTRNNNSRKRKTASKNGKNQVKAAPAAVKAAAAADDDDEFDALEEHRQNIRQVLRENASSLKIESVVENVHAKPGTPLYDRFMKSWLSVEDSTVQLCFHGTPESNIAQICCKGLDPGKRLRQAHGPGEYFAVNASTSVAYCGGGRKMLVVAVIMDRTGLTKNNGSVVVVHKPEHHLPLFVVTFSNR